MARRKQIPAEALIDLRRRLEALPPKSRERLKIIEETASLYGISVPTVYRHLRETGRPKPLYRADRGQPRVMPQPALERYCEVIAALKRRTENRKGRRLSTDGAIQLLEDPGVETAEGLVKAPAGVLKRATVDRYLKSWQLDHERLTRQPVAVRFQAAHSNDCWQFDLTTSDLKQVKKPEWFDPQRGHPLLMLYSVVDDRSGAAYMEYHGVYGEDVGAALQFLFRAMAPKEDDNFPFQGIPRVIYMDNGPIARSLTFQKVMGYLGVEIRTHLPAGSDGRRVTARSKGKVERPFRSVKEMHETIYHLREPETEKEANSGLLKFLKNYNRQTHRSEAHARIDDWLANLPKDGIREMCRWERFCTFAREPDRRKVGLDARVSIDGVAYEVDHNLAGETVVLWWGLFDNDLYVEHEDERYGPYLPVGGPIPLDRYRKPKKTRTQQRADRIEVLARQLKLPGNPINLGDSPETTDAQGNRQAQIASTAFVDPDPFQNLCYRDDLTARMAISEAIGLPLAKLSDEQLSAIKDLLARTLSKQEVLEYIRTELRPALRRGLPC